MPPRLWPIHHTVCHPVLKLPHWIPVVRPPQRCFPQRRIKNLKCFCTCLQYSLLAFLLILLILLIGKTVEQNHVERAQSTIDLYNKSQVCALMYVPENVLNNKENTSTAEAKSHHSHHRLTQQHDHAPLVTTLDSITIARNDKNTLVAHCGDCGQCSNPHDVAIYDKTKNTLTDISTKCAKIGLFGGRTRATRCLLETAGLTEPCTKCWVDNIMCDVRNCVFTCLWRQFTSWGDEKSVGGQLNDCTKCDELRCGRAFLTCAGANRRRTGIVSDIERDFELEVCPNADEEFWKSNQVQLWYQSMVANETTTTNDDPETRLLRGGLPS